MNENISRRDFIKRSGAATLGMMIVPNTVLGRRFGHTAPSDKLNIAGIGIGGVGRRNLKNMATENIVALCDVDWKYADKTFRDYPNARRFKDWRVMFDEMGKSIDAIMVATPDHTHAGVTAHAMTLGKHVYCQKPLTHSVYEARLLAKLAKKYRVATQMGNQGNSFDWCRRIAEWIWAGEIGEVREVHCWTDRPIWPQGLNLPTEEMPVPGTLDWDLWLGPAVKRPYHSVYLPWNWRGWYDFGTGALGDMACHILQPAFQALNLLYPIKVQGSSTLLLTDCAPNAEYIKYVFPARDNMPKVGMPEVEINWYDGGLMPERPAGLEPGKSLNNGGGGLIFYGTKDILICGCYGRDPYLVSGRVPNAPKVLREVPAGRDNGHQADWARACKEDPEYRVKTASDFSVAGPLNEMVVMGVLAVRLQNLNRILEWDGENMCFTNIPKDATIRTVVKDGFSIKDGHPTFNKTWTDPVDANAYAAELIKHTYREGWSLPDMPR